MHENNGAEKSDIDFQTFLEKSSIEAICRKSKDIKTVDKCNEYIECELQNLRRKPVIAVFEKRKDELWNE